MRGNARPSGRKDTRSWGALVLACGLSVSLCFNVALGWEVQARSGDRRTGIGYLAVDALPSLRLLSSEGEAVALIPDRKNATVLLVLGPAAPECSAVSTAAYSPPGAPVSYRTVVVMQGMDVPSLRAWLRVCAAPSHVYLLEYGMQLVASTPAIVVLRGDGRVKAIFAGPLAARPWSEIAASALAASGK